MKLSKTDYLIWRDCPHNAWLKKHRRDVYNAKPLSAFDQGLLDTGNEVDVLARDRFPGGVTIERGEAARTADLVAARTPVLYQPVFETDQLTTACDILVWNGETKLYDLYEVKASTSGDDRRAKDELYTYDSAFQAEVLRQNKLPLGRLYIVRLDSTYVRGDTLDVHGLFAIDDFTERAAEVRDEVALEIDTAHEALSSKEPLPAPCGCIYKGRNQHCTTFAHTNPQVPGYSVHDIARIGSSKKKLAQLIDRGIMRVEDVPDDIELSELQQTQVHAAKTKRTAIDHEAVAEFLAALSYPLAFLDYETYPAGVPRFAGYGPYHHVPFQFSLDVIERAGAKMRHFEFLHTDTSCPDAPLIAALRRTLPASGSVVTWNQVFETGINDKLAERNPDDGEFLHDLNARVVDLMDVFSTQAYVHPQFRGRTSIKAILPVLVPQLSYKTLAIQEGATATAKWNEIMTGKVDAVGAAKIRADLLAYCGLDTLAMVEIWRVLEGTIEGRRKAS